MAFDLAAHAVGIGMTGWNWQARESLWVGFDFDAITGHSDAHAAKLTDAELKAVRRTPPATSRGSPSAAARRGSGLHLYVYLDGYPTENHTEHAALARAILGMMSRQDRVQLPRPGRFAWVGICGCGTGR